MSEPVKIAVILSVAAIICTGIAVYFGEFQSCVRAMHEIGWEDHLAKVNCARK